MKLCFFSINVSFSAIKLLKIVLLLSLTLKKTSGARILGVLTLNSFSHVNINNAIMETLAMAGHEVTVISYFKPESPPSNTSITYIQMMKNPAQNFSHWTKYNFNSMTWWQLMSVIIGTAEKDCYNFIALKEIQDLLTAQEKKFDLMFVDLSTIFECYLPVAKQQNMPVIGIFLSNMRKQPAAAVGNPIHPAVVPFAYSARVAKMTPIQRLMNSIETLYYSSIYEIISAPRIARFYHQYFPQYDPCEQNQVSLLFYNHHHSISQMPMVPTVIEIAGIHIRPRKSLPKDMEEFIQGAKHGTIVISFGTVTDTMVFRDETIPILRDVFAEIPQRVIWKSGENVGGISDNVLISKWIPQQDILAHENVILFISHLGKSSTIEAIHTATPVLAIPIFADQFSSAATITGLGVGKTLDIRTLTRASLLSNIQEIIEDKSYVERMKKLSKKFNDRKMSPKETVIFWTEYVLRHNGTDHLRTAEADMKSYQYFLLDIILFTIAMLIVILFVLNTIRRSLKRKNE